MSKKAKKIIFGVIAALLCAAMLLPLFVLNGHAAEGELENYQKLLFATEAKSHWGSFTLTESSRFYIVTEGSGAYPAEMIEQIKQVAQLAASQFAADGRPSAKVLPVVYGHLDWVKAGDIVLYYNDGVSKDGYTLCFGLHGNTVTVQASQLRGSLYGLNALLKCLRLNDGATIGQLFARSVPDTAQRAVSLDCGRKYYSKNWICNFIREMSWMGYNTLELHFSDDSGFRMDFWDEKYYTDNYRPANDFSWICGSNYTSWTLADYQKDPDKGKYLTTAEVIEILQTAAEYHIDVIPAFDSPSHLDYMTWKFEQNYKSNSGYSFYSTHKNKTYNASDVNGIINYTNSSGWSTPLQWPYYSTVNVKGEQAKAFIFELYIDIANFFKEYSNSTDFSIGADEVNLNTANLASGYSFTWGFADFVNYINELNILLNGKGYTMRMYNDFMGSIAYNAANYDFADNIKILYWDGPFDCNTGTNENQTQPVSYWVNDGRILYNCIQTNTYYALRKTETGSDARSINNRQWRFYHSNEEDIYNEWYAADISEHGDYSENTADVPAANLGGAYFLIWGDYACVSTEAEIWNGCYDTSGSGEYYSLRDRMWSNITKMWKSKANNSVTFEDFKKVRDQLGDFPGVTTCSDAASLPAAGAVTEAYLADHTALIAALENKEDSALYTTDSYAVYEAAYTAAQTVRETHSATQTEVDAAVKSLSDAKLQLVMLSAGVTLRYLDTNGNEIMSSRLYEVEYNSIYTIQIYSVNGYKLKSVTGANFVPNTNSGSAGTLTGTMRTAALTVTLTYESVADIIPVKTALASALTEQGEFSQASWTAYRNAVTALNTFYNANKSNPASTTTQQAVCEELNKLQNAYNQLVIEGSRKKLISLKLTSDKVSCGKQAVVLVTTTADIAALSVEGKTLERYYAQITTDEAGNTVKVWYLTFAVTETATHTLLADGATLTTFNVTCG